MLSPFRKHIILTIPQMHDIALRYIFDRQNVRADEYMVLQESLEAYCKLKDLNDGDKWEIHRIINALTGDEQGRFNRAKYLMERHNIHYRQFYKAGLPFIRPNRDGRFWNKS